MSGDRVVIVGPGRMGLALGAALWQAEALERLSYQGRALEPPPHPLFDAGGAAEPADEPPADYDVGPRAPPPGTTVVVLAVPDDALERVTRELAMAGDAPDGCVALHLAGALSTDVLAPLHGAGYALGSMHPLQAVADPFSGGDRLSGAAFALAGEPLALRAAKRLVRAVGGRPLVIPRRLRPLYHAAAVTASNYLVVLAAMAARLLMQAGVDEDDALPALLPLMRGTLDNLEHLGGPAALTGPVARGDTDTVRMHLARLSSEDRALYCALGREAADLARAAGLDEAAATELDSLFDRE